MCITCKQAASFIHKECNYYTVIHLQTRGRGGGGASYFQVVLLYQQIEILVKFGRKKKCYHPYTLQLALFFDQISLERISGGGGGEG